MNKLKTIFSDEMGKRGVKKVKEILSLHSLLVKDYKEAISLIEGKSGPIDESHKKQILDLASLLGDSRFVETIESELYSILDDKQKTSL